VQASDLLAVAFESTAVVTAPTHDGGTAVMKLAPPTAIPLAYGHQSAAQHAAAAKTVGCTLTVVHRPGFTADLDTPADLADALQMLSAAHPTPHFGARTRQVLMSQHTANAATLRPSP
jgi:2-phospho-L-lactate guanylyltransferase (CobY/MobA/RfbA family)